jgi:hypothetical protein
VYGQFRVQSVDPPANSILVSVYPDIVVEFSDAVDPISVDAQSIRVYGEMGGGYAGQIFLEDGNRKLRFRLERPFLEGEFITVVLSARIRSASGSSLVPYQWSFTVRVEYGVGDFPAKKTYPLSGMKDPVAIHVADLNRDFRPDIITANNADHTVSILVNEFPAELGEGFAAAISIPVGQGPTSVAGGDFNRDGFQDLLVTNLLDNTVSLLLNGGTGDISSDSFLENRIAVGKKPVRTAVADFNSDGWLDFAVLLFGADEVEIYQNDGQSGFARTGSIAVGLGPSGIVARDFDLDGDVDLVIGSTAGQNLSVLANDGTGSFSLARSIDTGVPVTFLASQDLVGGNSSQPGDGILELVAVSPNKNTVQVFRPQGGTTDFELFQELKGAIRPYGVAIGNFEMVDSLDFDLDIVSPNFVSGKVALFRNLSAEQFEQAGIFFDVGFTPFALAAADFNGDRTLDVAVTNLIQGQVTVLWNRLRREIPPVLICEDGGGGGPVPRIDFGDVYIGDQKEESLSFRNPGARPVYVTEVSVQGDSSQAFEASLSDDVVLPGDWLTLRVTFTPPDTGAYAAMVIMKVSDTFFVYEVPVQLTGRGVMVSISVDPPVIDFGVVAAGFNKRDSLWVQNSGNDTLEVSPQAIRSPVFTVLTRKIGVPPYRRVALPVTFSPLDTIAYQDTLRLRSNDRSRPEVKVLLLGAGYRNAPRITSADTATAIEDIDFEYVATAVDPDGTQPIITFVDYPHWLQPDGNRLIGTPREGDLDTSFVVLASDGFLYDTLRVALTVIPVNDAPVLDFISDKTVTERDLLAFTVRASDPEDSLLAITAQSLPPGATLSATGRNQAQFSWTPDFGTAGEYVVTFVVTEQVQVNPLSSTQDVRITVQKRLPDLIATALEGDLQDVRLRQTRTVRGTLQNVNAPVDRPFVLAILLNDDVVADTTIMSLPPEAEISFEAPVTFLKTGSNRVTFVVDHGDQIEELDETNNQMSTPISVTEGHVVARPNPFTPNDDGYNDRVVFDLRELVLSQPRLRIYSFEGRLLRNLVPSAKDRIVWDGRDDNGREQLPGVYLFVLQDGGSVIESGYVVLAR